MPSNNDLTAVYRQAAWQAAGLGIMLVLGLSPLQAGQSVSGNSGASIPGIDALFEDYAHDDTPGCALGVIRDGEFIYRRGYGMANLEHDIPITSSSVFRIASTSKQFAAMAVALLADEGKISLDDPLSDFFPEFPSWAKNVTVRQLLMHTSGIRDYLTLASLVGKGGDQDY